MSRVLDFLGRACDGISRYLEQNGLIVVLMAILLCLGLLEKKRANENQNRVLVYTLIMSVLLLCPLTAFVVMVYQTAFYDYEWAWSLVPVTATTAYGLVLLWSNQRKKKQKIGLIMASILLLCLIGNQGDIRKVSTVEAQTRKEIGEVIQGVYSVDSLDKYVIWAPERIMKEVRRYDGRLLLVYGRDMWDSKAGAYDYESYEQELTDAYLWLEKVMEHYDLAVSLEKPDETLGFLDEQYMWSQDMETHLENVMREGANTIILPNLVGEYVEDSVSELIQKEGLNLKKAYTEEYIIYVAH